MRDIGVKTADIKDVFQGKCWAYLTLKTTEQLDANRRDLGESVGPLFMRYLQDNWVPKKKKVVYLYTSKYANLGSSSTQRSESYHDTVTELVNA